MLTGQSVVPIGGAPFIRPYANVRAVDTILAASYSPSHQTLLASSSTTTSPPQSPSSHFNTLLPSHGSSASSSVSSSPTSSAAIISPSSSSPSISSNNPQLEAALRYSSALHQHTRNMWEKERLSIEKLRFEGSHDERSVPGAKSASSSSSAAAAAAAGRRASVDTSTPNRRSSFGSAFTAQGLFGRKRRGHQKNKSIY